jgi:replicative DNA helicase
VLKKIGEATKDLKDLTEEEIKNYNTWKCDKCGDVILEKLENGQTVSYICSCKKQEQIKARLEKFKKLSIIDRNYGNDIFSNAKIDTKEEKELYLKIKKYVQNFDKILEINDGLLFCGGAGTGKTFLANCICNYLRAHNYTVLSFNLGSYLRTLKDDFSQETALLKAVEEADMLFIDDLGSEKVSDEWGKEKIYSIIDTRYRASKPIIITTNLDMVELKEFLDFRNSDKIVDRIKGMTKVFKFTWGSKRKTAKIKKSFWE